MACMPPSHVHLFYVFLFFLVVCLSVYGAYTRGTVMTPDTRSPILACPCRRSPTATNGLRQRSCSAARTSLTQISTTAIARSDGYGWDQSAWLSGAWYVGRVSTGVWIGVGSGAESTIQYTLERFQTLFCGHFENTRVGKHIAS